MEGRLEICDNHEWGTVCSNMFGELDAMVACRQLGYAPIGNYSSICNYFYIHPLICNVITSIFIHT